MVEVEPQPKVFAAGTLERGHAELDHPVQHRAGDLGFGFLAGGVRARRLLLMAALYRNIAVSACDRRP